MPTDYIPGKVPSPNFYINVILNMNLGAGDLSISDNVLNECFLHIHQPEDRGNILRLRSRNHFLRGNYTAALNDTLLALKVLGIEVNLSPTRRQADVMFEEVKNEILAVGFDEILMIPRTTDPRTELAVSLLNDAGKCSDLPAKILPAKYQCRCQRVLEPVSILLRRCHWTYC